MKLLLAILLFATALASAQVNLLKQMLDYYPLQTGDYWEYKTWSMDWSTLSNDSSAYSIEVIGDTMLANSYQYEILRQIFFYSENDTGVVFERLDSSTGCLYKAQNSGSGLYDIKLDSLFAQPGDTMVSSWIDWPNDKTICDSIVNDTVLSMPTQARYAHNIFYGEGIGVGCSLAKGIGFVSQEEAYDFGTSGTSLVYANINEKGYGTKIPSAVKGYSSTPMTFTLFQNYPNPFNPTTTIIYRLPMVSHVTLKVYDVLGREVMTLVDGKQNIGEHSVVFDASRLGTGVYFYKLTAGSFSSVKKLMLIK